MNIEETPTSTIYLAGGCFWGTQHLLQQIPGVVSTQCGYANSRVPNPTYEEVCTGKTGASETVKVKYALNRVSLRHILDIFISSIDPTSLNRQGGDRGTQYRTGIYYTDPEQYTICRKVLDSLQSEYSQPIVVEISEIKNFYPAEEDHQYYLDKNPQGYCHVNPVLFKIAKSSQDPYLDKSVADSLRERLTPIQYEVTQNSATEPPFTGKYYMENRPGLYVDVVSGEPLFLSTQKFQSGCGWPAFAKPVSENAVTMHQDSSHGMHRIEVRSTNTDSHLGHVFNDGPSELGGMRYCINSAALRFIPLDKMEKEGYGKYIPLIEKP